MKAGERIAACVRAVLATRDLTLHQVCVASTRIYGQNSPSRIPHTLYHSLTSSGDFTPSLAQTCALSRITGYRFEDWLEALGINLARIGALQAVLPLKRTRMMDPAFDRVDSPPRSPVELAADHPASSDCPTSGEPPNFKNGRASGVSFVHREQCSLFVRIGYEDSFAFPELLPGSIIRLDPARAKVNSQLPSDRPPLLVIEHDRGLWCGRFHVSGNGVVHAATAELAYAQIAFQCPHEARIVGVADMEIRWINRFQSPKVPQELAIWQRPRTLTETPERLSVLIRRARGRAGLTLREASVLSQRVSLALDDERYSIAQSTLSDYEAASSPPRHLEKVVTLCLLYGIKLLDFASASGNAVEQLGRQLMPQGLISQLRFSLVPNRNQNEQNGVMPDRSPSLADFGQVPWFLAGSLAELSGIARPSPRDFFRLTGENPFLPAHTQGSILVLADRRKKKPMRIPELLSWQQPAWLLLLRGGRYMCACCSLDQGTLLLYPESEKTRSPERLRLGRDAEVIGQVVALARRIP